MAHRGFRDTKTGRFARRPVAGVDAESRFDPMGDGIEDIEDMSGAASPSTFERPRYAPAGDELAQLDARSPLRSRRPELVHPDDAGSHNAILRTAVRGNAGRWDDPTSYLVGLESHGEPVTGVRQVSDEGDDLESGYGDLRPASRGLGRGRDR